MASRNTMKREKVEAGILGATGAVGQQCVALLAAHPWFRLTWLAASEHSAGKRFGDLPWRIAKPRPAAVEDLLLQPARPDNAPMLVFSAMDAAVAGEIEEAFARAGRVVISNARSHRMDPLVPLLVPEINADHLQLLPQQRKAYGWSGAIITNPNCSTVFLSIALAALRRFEPVRATVSTLQALSGAGYPGVAALDALANVIPYISGEEEKIEMETRKILGRLRDSSVEPHPVRLSAQATRVPVLDGHTELVSIEFGQPASLGQVREAFESFAGVSAPMALPSAPARLVVCHDAPDRPQPKLDGESFGGMAVHVGRLRPCAVLGWKFVLLGHNTIRGAAGAAILNAELLLAHGWLPQRAPACATAS
jgi:aspartate-semialdehyde dehydrogenase